MAIGTVLHQVQEGVERVLGYYSKSLNSVQRNYCTTKKELVAIVAMFNQWDVYLSCLSEPFVLHMDQAALTWLKKLKHDTHKPEIRNCKRKTLTKNLERQ